MPGSATARSARWVFASIVAVVLLAAGVTTAYAESAEVATRSAAVAPLSANTDAGFTALNNAFLVSSGSQRYYRESLNNAQKDYFWRQALDIQAAEDVYDSTGRVETRDLIKGLLDTFLQQNQGSGGLTDWNWNEYNDDLNWAGLAFARGYRITGNRTYLAQAQYAFNRVYDRGWDTALGGGIWWDIRKQEKSAVEAIGSVVMQAVTPAIRPSGAGIVSAWNSKCVDVPASNYSNGVALTVWTCNGGGNQRWESVNGGFRTQNNMCVSVAGGSTADGAAIQLATCSGNAAQQFVLGASGNLVNTQSHKCVDIAAWNQSDGAVLSQWTCNGGANQKWRRG